MSRPASSAAAAAAPPCVAPAGPSACSAASRHHARSRSSRAALAPQARPGHRATALPPTRHVCAAAALLAAAKAAASKLHGRPMPLCAGQLAHAALALQSHYPAGADPWFYHPASTPWRRGRASGPAPAALCFGAGSADFPCSDQCTSVGLALCCAGTAGKGLVQPNRERLKSAEALSRCWCWHQRKQAPARDSLRQRGWHELKRRCLAREEGGTGERTGTEFPGPRCPRRRSALAEPVTVCRTTLQQQYARLSTPSLLEPRQATLKFCLRMCMHGAMCGVCQLQKRASFVILCAVSSAGRLA